MGRAAETVVAFPLSIAMPVQPVADAAPDPPGEPRSLPRSGRGGVAALLAEDCLCLAGPTAAGKSALAVALAERIGAEIVSADSMAIYTGLDIGTAKPSLEQRARVPHHLVDIVSPAAAASVADWLSAAAAAFADIRRRGRRILVCGGTPLYLKALRDGLDELPAADAATRARLEDEADRLGLPVLHARLAAADPQAAGRVHPADRRRIVRALEIVAAGGRAGTGWQRSGPSPWGDRLLVIDRPRRLLAERIERRVDAMFAAGLLDEVRGVVASGGIGPTARQAAGYAECLAFLAGQGTLADAVARTKQRTRQLAKRQLTWLRSFPEAIWISA